MTSGRRTKIGVVILNYMSYNDTIDCVNSFLNAFSQDVDVQYAVVDNGSHNGSYEILVDKFGQIDNIFIIKLEENVGFANGNNAGLDYLKDSFKPDYYIFSNSDIIVPSNIFSWILSEFKLNKCDLLGPDIYAPILKIHQNPIKKYTLKPFVVSLKIWKKRIELLMSKFGYYRNSLNGFTGSVDIESRMFDCALHGSFIISNDRFIDYFYPFFNKKTFMYMEEYFLYAQCKKYGLKTLVSYNNSVVHLQGGSTNTDVSKKNRRFSLRLKNEIRSMKAYRDFLQGNK